MTKLMMSRSAPAWWLWLIAVASTRSLESTAAFTPASRASSTSLPAYLDTAVEGATTVPSGRMTSNKIPATVAAVKEDTVQLGTLTIPRVGVGTIAWSADKGTLLAVVCVDVFFPDSSTNAGILTQPMLPPFFYSS